MIRNIVLQSDFGIRDGAAAVMEGVIDRINPDVKVKHLTHKVEAFDIAEGAFLLLTNYWHYRPGTIFVSVIDPEVGTDRKILLAEGEHYCFIGPDNGLLWPIIETEKIRRVIALNEKKIRDWAHTRTKDNYFERPVSNVFEGRDIYCPAAALFAQGVYDLGEVIEKSKLRKISFTLKKRPNRLEWVGEVVYIDDYGNLLVACTERDFRCLFPDQRCTISIKNQTISRISKTYAEGKEGELIAIFGGDFEHPTKSSFLEVAINEGNAAATLGAEKGEKIIITRR